MSDPATPDNGPDRTPLITGRCYCGATTFSVRQNPLTVAYCHCSDCRRFTGGPVAAFAAFRDADVHFTPDEGQRVEVLPGAVRSFCRSCGSPLTGRYDYLPGQVYIALGILDQADDLPPRIHAHADSRIQWLHIQDDLPQMTGSSRAILNAEGKA